MHATTLRRYAGRAYESEAEASAPGGGGGKLIVKGLKSMWRQAAPIVRTTLHGALVRILMEDDIRWVHGVLVRILMENDIRWAGAAWRMP